MAAPICAFNETRICSAWRMSGRRSRTSEGIPAGRAGRTRSSIDLPLWIGPGLRPRRIERAFSVWAIWASICGMAAAAVSYWVLAC